MSRLEELRARGVREREELRRMLVAEAFMLSAWIAGVVVLRGWAWFVCAGMALVWTVMMYAGWKITRMYSRQIGKPKKRLGNSR